MYIFADCLTLVCPCVGVHRRESPRVLSLLLQHLLFVLLECFVRSGISDCTVAALRGAASRIYSKQYTVFPLGSQCVSRQWIHTIAPMWPQLETNPVLFYHSGKTEDIYHHHHLVVPSARISLRCPWCNGYRRRKWIQRYEFKSWMSLIAFHTALMPLRNVWIQ